MHLIRQPSLDTIRYEQLSQSNNVLKWTVYGIYGVASAGVGLAAVFADSRVRSVPYTSLTEHFDIAAMVICAGEMAIAHSISGRYECPNAKLFLNGGQDIDLSGQIDTCMKDVTNSNCWIPPLPPMSEIRNYLGPAQLGRVSSDQ